jgi:hypothetical protein
MWLLCHLRNADRHPVTQQPAALNSVPEVKEAKLSETQGKQAFCIT